MPDPHLISSRVGLAHISFMYESGQVFFRLGRIFLVLGWVFSDWVRFLGKNHGPHSAHQLLRVKKYGPRPPVVLLGSDWVGFFSDGFGLVGRVR